MASWGLFQISLLQIIHAGMSAQTGREILTQNTFLGYGPTENGGFFAFVFYLVQDL
jgi:hypothetical protein